MIEYCKAVINETPLCFWRLNLRQDNIKFLKNVVPNYYWNLIKKNEKIYEEDKDDLTVTVLIRQLYCQSLETLFSYIFALIQSPDCMFGWLSFYNDKKLRKLCAKVNDNKSIYNKFNLKDISWEVLSEHVYLSEQKDQIKKGKIIKEFAKFWNKLAKDYIDNDVILEYNSIKHGVRIMPGGVSFSFGKELIPGVRAPKENMVSLGGSKYGTTFYLPEFLSDNDRINITFAEKTVNWSPETIILRIYLISMSINNIISAALIYNGDEPKSVMFENPDKMDAFEEAFNSRLGVLGINNKSNIRYEDVKENLFKEEDIFDEFKNNENI